jgi:exonuclease V gamma subunit
MKKIPAFLGQPEFKAVKNYLVEEQNNRRLYQLADIVQTGSRYS